MAEIATGKDWNLIFLDNVVRPLSLSSTDYAPFLAGSGTGFTPVSNPRLAGGMRTTIDDYTAVMNMLARNGLAANGTQVLKAETVRVMDINRATGTRIFNTPLPTSAGYAIGHWVLTADAPDRPLEMASAGAFGLTPFINRTLGYGAVWLIQGRFGLFVPSSDIVPIVDAAMRAGTAANETGVWWNPLASGTGVALSRQGDTLFAALYGYGADQTAQWLVAPAMKRETDNAFRGDLYVTLNSASGVASIPVGTLEIGPPQSGTTKRTFKLQAQGRNVNNTIEPFVFSVPTYCRAGSDARETLTNLTDVWWDPAQPGVGVAIAQQQGTIFAAIYRYDAAGAPRWYVASSAVRGADGSFAGTLYLTKATGTQDQPNPTSTAVGNFTLAPTNGRAGVLRYDINGVASTLNLQRFDFAAPQSVCY